MRGHGAGWSLERRNFRILAQKSEKCWEQLLGSIFRLDAIAGQGSALVALAKSIAATTEMKKRLPIIAQLASSK